MSTRAARSFFYVAFADCYPSVHTTAHGRSGFVASFAVVAVATDSDLYEWWRFQPNYPWPTDWTCSVGCDIWQQVESSFQSSPVPARQSAIYSAKDTRSMGH